jgi:methyl-accepting chemotaxis protein
MKSLRIVHTIYLLLGCALLAGGLASTFLMVRCAGISERYTNIIQGEVAQAQQVRVLQVDFKKQVQAWKDILLRGKDDAALAKYEAEFRSESDQVDSAASGLEGQVHDEQAHAGLAAFNEQHKVLNQQYEAALAGFVGSRDTAQADKAVKGKDRAPTDSLDNVVDRLTGLAEALPKAEAAQLHREQVVLIPVLVLLWAALGLWSMLFSRSLGRRLGVCVQFVHSIAENDLTAETPETGRGDEIGVLIEAISHMRNNLRELVGAIKGIATHLASSAQEVSESSAHIATATADQRGQSTQVAAALEEMIASVREVTMHCHEAAERAIHTGKLANGSSQTVEAVASQVRDLSTDAQSNAKTVNELGERTGHISQIVTLIEEIAGQTNLLALNAAIESARAGEHGRGFAVVAGEVRRLAERTSLATKEIADAVLSIQDGTREAVQSIEGSSGRVANSVSTANAAAQSLSVLGGGAEEVQQRIQQIAQAAEEQTQASGMVGESMNAIAQSISASSEAAQETARTAEELAELSHQLKEQISQFKTGGETDERPRGGVRRAV